MATKQSKSQNRYRRMRSAFVTASVLGVLPLFVLMKSGTGNASTTADLATAAQAIAVSASPTQTTSSQDAASPAGTSAASTSSKTTAASATTYTRTKAS